MCLSERNIVKSLGGNVSIFRLDLGIARSVTALALVGIKRLAYGPP